jgi:hypothetical protein
VLEGAEAIEAQRKHAESNASSEMFAMGTGSKLKMNEPKLRKAWEGTHTYDTHDTRHTRLAWC